MLTTALSFLLFLVLIYKVPIFKRDGAIERNMLPDKAEFTIASMPFRVERIVYYVPIPNPTYGKDPHLEEHMTVEYVKKQTFDASPFALQVYYQQGSERKLLAEVLSHRFDVPYLDTLYGENLLSYKEYEYLRLYKYNHPSTKELLREEVKRKLTKGNNKI